MAWIEVHQSLPTHPKTLEAAMLLEVPEAEVVGHMVCLWVWAIDAKPDGQLDLSKPRIIARAAQWDKEPGRFVDALVAVRFLDEDGAIHDWDDYTGRLMERRERTNEQTRARMQAYRERRRLSSIEEPVTQDVTRNKSRRYASVTASYAPTQPNPTVPNPTNESPTTPVDRVAPTVNASDALVPTAPPATRARDPLWDALQSVFPKGPRTDAERGKWNTAAAQLRKGGVTAEEVVTAAAHWPNVMSGATMTPMGIASNLGLLLDGPQVNGRSNGVTHSLQQTIRQSASLPPDDMALMRAAKAARRPH
jgi:hypothetical protein